MHRRVGRHDRHDRVCTVVDLGHDRQVALVDDERFTVAGVADVVVVSGHRGREPVATSTECGGGVRTRITAHRIGTDARRRPAHIRAGDRVVEGEHHRTGRIEALHLPADLGGVMHDRAERDVRIIRDLVMGSVMQDRVRVS